MASGRMEAALECPVCLDRFEAPRVLPCQHTFCTHCLQEIEERDGIVRCPECRAEYQGPVNRFPTNVTIQRLLSAAQLPNVPSSNIREPVPTVQPTAPPMPPPSPQQPIHEIQTQQEYPPQTQQPPGAYIPAQNYYPYPSNPQQPTWNPPSRQPPLPRIPERNGRNNQPPSHVSCQASTAAERRNRDEEDECNWNRCKGTFLEYFEKVRQGIRKVISSFLRRFTKRMSITITVFLLITFSRFVAGAVKLSSDCPKEKHVAEYLFVKSWFAFLFWGTLSVLRCKKKLVDAMDNLFIELYVVVVEGIFSLIWLIVGTVWTIGFREEMLDECPILEKDWNKSFITFAMVLVIFDWIAIGIFLFYSLYIMFDRSEQRNNN